MHPDRDSRVTIEWLQDREPGSAIRWASDHFSPERPWARGWVDVRIPGDGPPGMAWVWTILTPEDPDQGEPGQLWQFAWPYDAETGGWSTGSVCDALADWAARHAGRPDLRFEWDRDAGPSAALTRAAERAAAGDRTWDLGDGLEVADGVMDDLLALDPAEAARITEILRDASRDFRGEDS